MRARPRLLSFSTVRFHCQSACARNRKVHNARDDSPANDIEVKSLTPDHTAERNHAIKGRAPHSIAIAIAEGI